MNRQEAIKALARAGQGDEVLSMIDEAAARASRRFDEIRRDGTRTKDYVRWALAVAYAQARRGLEEKLVAAAQAAVRADRDDAERVFGVRGLTGDPASLVISMRDAGDRAASIDNAGELSDLLARATRSGDEVLARAIAGRALAIGSATVLNQFAEDRPQLDAAVERLWKAERATEDGGLSYTVRMMGLRPSELSEMSPGGIEALARQAEPGTVSGDTAAWVQSAFSAAE